MKMWLVALVVFVVVGSGAHLLAANSHMDIFPCVVTRDNPQHYESPREETLCSLLQLGRYYSDERAELTTGGYVAVAAYDVFAGMLIAVPLGLLLARRKRRAATT